MPWQPKTVTVDILPVTVGRMEGIVAFMEGGNLAGIQIVYQRGVQLPGGEVRTERRTVEIPKATIIAGQYTVQDFIGWVQDQVNTAEGLVNE